MTGPLCCALCGADLPAGAKFCPECAAPQARSCAACSSPLPANAKFCPECATPVGAGAAGEAARSSQSVSERRVTSVLFGDLVGFTTLSESRDQEDVRELLSRYFDACRTVMQRYGGTVEKFIGDAVMAVWGVPVAHEDDAERAVRAGLEIIDAVHALRDETGVPGLDMRVGIVTGEVAVTIGAVAQGMVAGDPVNTASRVQSVAAPGQVWVDETTRLLTHAAITFEDVGSYVLKGKADPVPLWAARAVVANRGGGQRADGLEAPHIGRAAELRLVKEVFHRSTESQSPNVLVVSADPGLGKSRLGWEFEKYIDGLTDSVRWLEGRCPAYGDGLAFHALAEAFRGRLQSRAEEDRDLGRLLEELLAEIVPDPSQRSWLHARTGVLLGLPGAGTYPREELFAAWVTVLEHLAAGASMVLLIDDAQHADDGLLDFLEFALTTRGLPLFVLLLTRPELLARRPTLAANPRVVTVHLQELSSVETQDLLDALVSGLPGPVRDELATRSEGVPLYAVETVRSLIDRDVVVPRAGRYAVAGADIDLTDLAAPASLQALVASRLDALPAEQRRVIDVASILGGSFAPDLLRVVRDSLGDGDGEQLDVILAALVRRQLLSVDTSSLSGEFGWYSFTQDVVRQVAYGMLARRDRREAHLAAVAALGDPPPAAALPVVAHHLLAAAETVPGTDEAETFRERALVALTAAGDWADELSAFGDAANHFQRAADLARADPARRADLLCRLTRSIGNTGDPAQDAAAEAVGTEAQRLFAELGDDDGQARAVGLTASLLSGHGHARKAEELVRPWWERYRQRTDADQAVLALALARVGIHVSGGGTSGIDEVALLGAKAAERLGDRPSLVRCLQGFHMGLDLAGYPELAGAVLAGNLAYAQRHQMARLTASLSTSHGSTQMVTDLAIARQANVSALHGHREIKNHNGIVVTTYNLAVIAFQRGAWSELDDLTADPDQLGFLAAVVDGFATLTRLARGQATAPVDTDAVTDDPTSHATLRVIEAIRTGVGGAQARGAALDAATELHSSMGIGEEFCTAYGVLTDALASLPVKDHEGLIHLLEVVPEDTRARLPLAMRGHTQRAAAIRDLAVTRPTTDVAAGLEAAVTAYREWGGTLYERRTQADLATVLDALDRHDEASALREQVREFYTEIGAHAWLADLDRVEAPSR